MINKMKELHFLQRLMFYLSRWKWSWTFPEVQLLHLHLFLLFFISIITFLLTILLFLSTATAPSHPLPGLPRPPGQLLHLFTVFFLFSVSYDSHGSGRVNKVPWPSLILPPLPPPHCAQKVKQQVHWCVFAALWWTQTITGAFHIKKQTNKNIPINNKSTNKDK